MKILDRRFGTALALLFLIALGLRLLGTEIGGGLGAPPDFPSFGLDVVEYESFAWSLSEGRGYSMPDGTPTARRAPGTSFTIFVIYALFGRSFLAARLWICALSALTRVVVAWVARPFLGSLVAFLAGA